MAHHFFPVFLDLAGNQQYKMDNLTDLPGIYLINIFRRHLQTDNSINSPKKHSHVQTKCMHILTKCLYIKQSHIKLLLHFTYAYNILLFSHTHIYTNNWTFTVQMYMFSCYASMCPQSISRSLLLLHQIITASATDIK